MQREGESCTFHCDSSGISTAAARGFCLSHTPSCAPRRALRRDLQSGSPPWGEHGETREGGGGGKEGRNFARGYAKRQNKYIGIHYIDVSDDDTFPIGIEEIVAFRITSNDFGHASFNLREAGEHFFYGEKGKK